jgi:chromosome segregation ATPase
MKAVLNVQKIKTFCLLAAMSFFTYSFAQTQSADSKKEAEIKKLENSLAAAKASLTKAEKQEAASDSLVTTGASMVTEGKAALKEIATERKAKDKEYNTQSKPLTKKISSKDKEEAASAKAELAKLDAQYKTDTKELDKKEKEANTKITTGESNANKGKMGKKTSAEALKKAQANYDAAQAKLEAVKSGEQPSTTGKKKK